MGLLDQAIRDHLELKRRRGAGESEIKRLEDEAFGLPERPGEVELAEPPPTEGGEVPEALTQNGEPRTAEESAADVVFEDTMPHDMEAELGALAEEVEHGAPAEEVEHAEPLSEESLELEDLELELEDEEPLGGVEAPAEEAEADVVETAPEEPEAELETPAEEAVPEGDVEETPPEESETEEEVGLGESPEEPAGGEDEPAGEAEGEDVLEETPEFLQDTPESERLWFEQRPPKDFDFDEE